MWRARLLLPVLVFLVAPFVPAVPLLPVSAAMAQDVLDAEAFDALTRGKTYFYGTGGQAYGAEEYLDGHRVRWSFLDGECLEGRWWQEGALICFAYEDRPDDHHCWSFSLGSGGLTARFADDPDGRVLYEVRRSDKPMTCLGPKTGV